VKAVVLVGGEGTRLRPLTLSVPKQMLPIVERPIVERVLEHLGAHGVDEAVLSLQYKPDAFTEAYPDGVIAGVRVVYVTEPEPLDTAGAVRYAAEEGGVEDTFVVVNGDVLTDFDLDALVAFHRSHGAEGTIRLYPVPDPSRFGVVVTDAAGKVGAFIEKPQGEAPTNLINAGAYVLEPEFLARVPLGERVSIEWVTFPAMVAEGQLFAMAEPSYWLDVGTPEAFLRANEDLLSGRRPGPPCPGASRDDSGPWTLAGVTLAGEADEGSFLGEGAVLEPGAEVQRSVLGAGAVVMTGANVEGSVVMGDTVVGSGARVTGSILGRGVRVGAECEVRAGSVIGFGVTLEPGRVVAGERVPG
jgi:mannose-1-phosphate guanylyltransferase